MVATCENRLEQLITDALNDNSELLLIDIMTDEQLIAEYQITIPVLKRKKARNLLAFCYTLCANF
ncbi:glutaredoxin family protein [Pseudoalteromonas sp. B193]